MKIAVEDKNPAFKPVQITINLESQEEVNNFYDMGRVYYNNNGTGSPEEALGGQIMDAIRDYVHE